jgi:threonyl-tRNA synthetase
VILNEVKQIINEKQPFERLVVSKEDALELFKYNKFKCEILHEKVKDGDYCTVYRCGDLIDPCKGPHLLHTGKVKAFDIIKNSSSYWRGDAKKESLQRVYGISYPESKMLEEWKELQEQLKQRDHRVIGLKQELWISHKMAPGMMFFLPHGQRIYNALLDLMKKVHRKRGFLEVQTPNMLSTDLWKVSGHYDHYRENMFLLKIDDSEHGLKPMNCPG